MMKINHWNDAQTAKEVTKRWQHAAGARRKLEDQWQDNEYTVYGDSGLSGFNLASLRTSDDLDSQSPDPHAQFRVSYVFKNLRFIHSQLSANPPSVAMKPTSSDQEDRRRADAADRVVRYAIRQYKMQENVDALTLNTLIYGTGAMKIVWDPSKGDIVEFDEQEGKVVLEGDISISIPHSWNLYLDPDARNSDQIKYVIERIYMDFDEAVAKWPEKKEVLEQARKQNGDSPTTSDSSLNSHIKEEHYNAVELLEYWETGLPSNGYLGRYCVVTTGGSTIVPCGPSTHRFPKAGSVAAVLKKNLPDEVQAARIAALPQMATLPYHILTDIDVANSVWGKSAVEYAAALQQHLVDIDTATLDNVRAHGAARLVVPEGAGVNTDLSNSPWDVVTIAGTQPPFFAETPALMPEMAATRQNLIKGIDDIMGVNEAMFGQQSREQSGASMQYATNQGNMIRRRLFNKYVLVVESIYKTILNLVRKHWPIERNILVLGKEKALESVALKGADIDGGYDVVGEYGVTLSLDPITRREEILALQPFFEKAGVPTRTSLKLMKLNELEGLYDLAELAETRQMEYFQEMIAKQIYLPPEEMQDHENMIASAMLWFMSAEFKYLDQSSKVLCRQHVKERIQLAAQEKAGGLSGQAPQPPGPAPAPPGPGQMPVAQAPVPGAPITPPIING
jgi:hypothetical protein